MRRALLVPWLALAPAAAAQELVQHPEAASYVVEVGSSVEVSIGPQAQVVVLDPKLVRVDEVRPQVISVTGLAGPGRAIVQLLGEGEPVTLVFTVEPAGPLPPSVSLLDTVPGAGLGESTQWTYRARGNVSGGPSFVAGLVQDLWIGRAFGPTRVQGNVSLVGQTGLGWDVPFVRLDVDHGAFAAGLGDRPVPFAEAIYLPGVRGAEVAWRPPRGHLGLVAGLGNTSMCCAFVDPDGDVVALAHGEVRVGSGTTLGGAGGVVYDVSTREALPLARVGAGQRWGDSEVRAEAFLSGRGGGASGRLDWKISRRVALLALGRFVSEGTYVRADTRQPGDTFVGDLVTRVEISERWQTWGGVSSSYVEAPRGPTSLSLGFQLGSAHRLSERDSLRVSYRQRRMFQDAGDGFAATQATHTALLGSWHQPTHPYRLDNQVQVTVSETLGPTSVQLAHLSRWTWADGLSVGILANGGWQASGHPGRALLAGDVSSRRRVVSLLGRAGVSADFGPDKVYAGPMVSAQLGWRVTPRHVVNVGGNGSYLIGTPEPAWYAYAQYTWNHGPRLAGRPLGIGAVRGVVFDDRNENGVRDPDEPGIAGAVVMLDDRRTRTTDAEGSFRMPLVSAGSHQLSVARHDLRSVDGTVREVEVQGLRTARVQYALTSGGRVLVRAYEDRDGDGAFSAGDGVLRVGAATVRTGEGEILSSRSVAALAEVRGVPPGTHEVSVDLRDLPKGWVPADTLRRPVEVETGSLRYVDLPVVAQRSVSGRVWVDVDGDGRRGPGDTPAADVPVRLDGHEVRTDAQGWFIFRRLPAGSYEVEVEGGLSRPRADLRNGPKEVLDLEVLVAPSPSDR